MKSLRVMLPAMLLMSLLATVTFAQSDTPKTQSNAGKSFDHLKALAGSWERILKTFPPTPAADGKPAQAIWRVTSLGNAQVFTRIDTNHHIEDWTFMAPEGKTAIQAHYLTRSK